VFGSAMAILLLGKELKLFHVIGYVLVLAGVTIAQGRRRRRPENGRARRFAGVPCPRSA
jgi:drug/metabolite transporter (DMT)-like permease